MKNRILLLLCCFLLSGCFSKTQARPIDLIEEAVPIREKDRIVGMNYYLTIPKGYPISDVIPTHIVDSIAHYKDLNSIDSFVVSIILKNETENDLELEKVLIQERQMILKRFSQDLIIYKGETNTFSISFSETLQNDYQVMLKLKD